MGKKSAELTAMIDRLLNDPDFRGHGGVIGWLGFMAGWLDQAEHSRLREAAKSVLGIPPAFAGTAGHDAQRLAKAVVSLIGAGDDAPDIEPFVRKNLTEEIDRLEGLAAILRTRDPVTKGELAEAAAELESVARGIRSEIEVARLLGETK